MSRSEEDVADRPPHQRNKARVPERARLGSIASSVRRGSAHAIAAIPIETLLKAAKRSEPRIEILVPHALDDPVPYPLNLCANGAQAAMRHFKGGAHMPVPPAT